MLHPRFAFSRLHSNRPPSFWIRLAWLALSILPATVSAADRAPTSSPDAANIGADTVELHASSQLSSVVSGKLSRGFLLATEWLQDRPRCRELFQTLGSDGLEALGYSFYVPVKSGIETSICKKGAIAYTAVGSPVTRLCPAFARLAERRAAIVLIHEALHHAGMGEKPLDPEALSADQITSQVTRQCS